MQQVTSLREIEQFIDEYGETIVSKNNKNNVIVMSMEEYKNKMFDNETIEKLLQSEKDIKEGKTLNAKEVISYLREEYGF